MKVVSNSTPLISLAATGQLDILKDIFSKIIIPEAVFEEVVSFGKGLPGSREVEEAKWIEVRALI